MLPPVFFSTASRTHLSQIETVDKNANHEFPDKIAPCSAWWPIFKMVSFLNICCFFELVYVSLLFPYVTILSSSFVVLALSPFQGLLKQVDNLMDDHLKNMRY